MYRKFNILIITIILTGCGRYLDVQPQGEVIPKTDEEFASILHTRLREIEGGGDECIIGNMEVIARLEGCADDLDANINAGSLTLYSGECINTMQLYYEDIWEVVRDCNILIENLSGRDTETAASSLSAAYAIKGICYYNLLRNFCQPWDDDKADELPGIPVVDKFDINAKPLRGTVRQTYEYIDGLFRKSLELNPKDKTYIFTEWIVKAYRAKLAFWCCDWPGTREICRDILDNSGFKLTPAPEYEEMINSKNDAIGEVLVRSHINNSSELDWYFTYMKGYLSSRPACASLIKLFGPEPEKDVRYAASFDRKRFNVKVPECRVRLSEIVLMMAEAACHENDREEALKWLNELRRNRIEGVEILTEDNLPAVRDDDRIKVDVYGKPLTPLLQAIFDERRKELYMEGDRWFELKRNGRPEWWIISNGLKYSTLEYLYTAPVSKQDVDLNPDFEQNPGYVY
ncbi:MAG: RagB/SusD family nutrient uptake outer membrane protein [Candidatus Cryptobacteroides sp.]